MDESELDELREEIRFGENGINTIITRSKKLYAIYSTVENSNDLKTICFVDKKEVDLSVISEVQKRNVFIVGNIVFLLFTIISMLYSSKALNKKIESVFYSDELTQSKNMNYFHDKAVELIQEEHRFSYLVARFDITNFRYINEAFGYERGNEILQTIANYAEDNFGSKEVFARNNADQFTALMVDLDDIEKRMNDFSKKINEYAKSIDVNFPIIFRTGYYHVKDNHENIDDIIDKANLARKSITRKSKRQTVEYTGGMQKNIKRREEIEASMEEALQKGEFKVYIQPKFDIMTNCVAGGEALVRWIRQDGSMIYPDEFISVFEQNGFIEKLDFYMLDHRLLLVPAAGPVVGREGHRARERRGGHGELHQAGGGVRGDPEAEPRGAPRLHLRGARARPADREGDVPHHRVLLGPRRRDAQVVEALLRQAQEDADDGPRRRLLRGDALPQGGPGGGHRRRRQGDRPDEGDAGEGLLHEERPHRAGRPAPPRDVPRAGEGARAVEGGVGLLRDREEDPARGGVPVDRGAGLPAREEVVAARRGPPPAVAGGGRGSSR
jgi:diguanylate cyclase (GGDEF)-like protein